MSLEGLGVPELTAEIGRLKGIIAAHHYPGSECPICASKLDLQWVMPPDPPEPLQIDGWKSVT